MNIGHLNITDRKQKWVLTALGASVGIIIGAASAYGYAPFSLAVPAVLVVIILCIFALRFKNLFYLLLVAALPFAGLIKIPNVPDPVLVALGGAAAIFLIIHRSRMNSGFHIDPTMALICMFLGVWTILSAINANDLASARLYWLVLILFFLTQGYLQEMKDFNQFAWVILLSLSLMAIMVLLQQVWFIFQSGGNIGIEALHRNANNELIVGANAQHVSTMAILGVPLAILLLIQGKDKSITGKWIGFMLIALFVSATIITFSVTGLVGLFAAFGSIFFFVDKRWRVQLLIIGAIIVAIVFASSFSTDIKEDVSITSTDDLLDWGSNRGLAYYTASLLIREAPWLGHGPGRLNVWEASVEYLPLSFLYQREQAGKGEGITAHNTYLGVATELGIPGLLFFMAILIGVWLMLWRSRKIQIENSEDKDRLRVDQALFVILISYAVVALANSFQTDKMFWLFLGVSAAYYQMTKAQSLTNTAETPKIH